MRPLQSETRRERVTMPRVSISMTSSHRRVAIFRPYLLDEGRVSPYVRVKIKKDLRDFRRNLTAMTGAVTWIGPLSDWDQRSICTVVIAYIDFNICVPCCKTAQRVSADRRMSAIASSIKWY